jgi:hypothetical protein
MTWFFLSWIGLAWMMMLDCMALMIPIADGIVLGVMVLDCMALMIPIVDGIVLGVMVFGGPD